MTRLIDANKLIDFIDVGHLRHPGELCYSEVDVAIEALDKQILKKPIEKYTDHDGTEAGLCPFCNEGVDEKMNFCSYCGQAIDWEDNE